MSFIAFMLGCAVTGIAFLAYVVFDNLAIVFAFLALVLVVIILVDTDPE